MKNFLNALASATGSTLSAASEGSVLASVNAANASAAEARVDRGSQLHWIFAVVVSVAPLLSTQLIFSSSPFLPPLKANLT